MKRIHTLKGLVVCLAFAAGFVGRANADSLVAAGSPAALGGNDTISWAQFGGDGTYTAQLYFYPVSVRGITVQAQMGGGDNLVSVVCPATTCGWTGDGFGTGESLLWEATPGTGPIRLNFHGALAAVGAYVQTDVPGPFTARIQAFNGSTLLGTFDSNSDSAGRALFVGVRDTTGANITSAVFSITSCAADCADFAVGTVSMDDGPTRVSVSPASLVFGPQPIGTESGVSDVSITNIGVLPFTLKISGSGDFANSNSCGSTLPGGQSCVVHVWFAPKGLGARSGQLSVGAGGPTVALTGTGAVPASPEPVSCYVFNDGYTSMAGPSDAVYISGRPADHGKACIPDGTSNGQCRKWVGRCFGTQTGLPVTFSVFNDGGASQTGQTDAVFINGQNQACAPNGTASGTCRKWFGMGRSSDGRNALGLVFNDGGASPAGPSGAVYIPTPLPTGGSACIPDGTAKGTCRRWFGGWRLQ